MKDDNPRQIIISKIIEHREDNSFQTKYSGSVSPVSRWLFYLALIPVTIVIFVAGFFFFSILLALVAVAMVGIGARIWWLRRQFNKAVANQEDIRSAEIEDVEIIETVIHKTNNKK